jgi:hypothetical protein
MESGRTPGLIASHEVARTRHYEKVVEIEIQATQEEKELSPSARKLYRVLMKERF